MKPYYEENPDLGVIVTADDLALIPWGTFTETRQECFMALEPTKYTYGSGRGVRTYESIPYIVWVENIRQELNRGGQERETLDDLYSYNVCFLNHYTDSGQHLGWHSDDSPGMSHEHPIAVVSFGQPREIWWRRIGQKGEIPPEQRQLLGNNSLFVMPPGFQLEYQHRIPKGDRTMGPRTSLTFRHYIP